MFRHISHPPQVGSQAGQQVKVFYHLDDHFPGPTVPGKHHLEHLPDPLALLLRHGKKCHIQLLLSLPVSDRTWPVASPAYHWNTNRTVVQEERWLINIRIARSYLLHFHLLPGGRRAN